jgi:hypothetical protein
MQHRQQCLMLVKRPVDVIMVLGLGTVSIASVIDRIAHTVTFGCPHCGRTVTKTYDPDQGDPDGLPTRSPMCTLYLTHTKHCPLWAHLEQQGRENDVDCSQPWWGQGEWTTLHVVSGPPGDVQGHDPEQLKEVVLARQARHFRN